MKKKDIITFPNKITHATSAKFINKLFEAGWTEQDLYRVGCYTDEIINLDELARVVRGEAEITIKITKHVVDSDARPNLHLDYIVSNSCYGRINLSKEKISLFTSPQQLEKGYIFYEDLKSELEGNKLMNAAVMVHFLKHQELIPKKWQEKERIYFLGTITGQPGDLSCLYIKYDKRSDLWHESRQNLSHWELGNRHSFTKDDAVATIKTRKRRK